MFGEFGQQVQIAKNQRALGDDGHRMAVTQQHFECLAGDSVFAFDRLIRVSVGAQVDRRALIAALGQLFFQHIGGVGLGDQFGFEIQPR
ncbi:hypothetical protein D3C85_1681220 [compost metagenome]